ncbi:MAG: hypothetical protein HYY36_02935, partial [Gammaproteobacteria bacterium]|nr:hypothetical protein [Gammaproteobacteria bacterium]
IGTVLIPKENERELVEIPKNIKQGLEIRPVRWIDEVLAVALQRVPEPQPSDNKPAEIVSSEEKAAESESDIMRTH